MHIYLWVKGCAETQNPKKKSHIYIGIIMFTSKFSRLLSFASPASLPPDRFVCLFVCLVGTLFSLSPACSFVWLLQRRPVACDTEFIDHRGVLSLPHGLKRKRDIETFYEWSFRFASTTIIENPHQIECGLDYFCIRQGNKYL